MERPVITVSGGFDPIHIGHVRMFKEASLLGNLIVIINNDNWLRTFKKDEPFMNENDRLEIVKSISYVYDAILTSHVSNDTDISICKTLEYLKPDIFANGGDRKSDNIPEYQLCENLGIEMVFNVGGGKIRSSSELTKNKQS